MSTPGKEDGISRCLFSKKESGRRMKGVLTIMAYHSSARVCQPFLPISTHPQRFNSRDIERHLRHVGTKLLQEPRTNLVRAEISTNFLQLFLRQVNSIDAFGDGTLRGLDRSRRFADVGFAGVQFGHQSVARCPHVEVCSAFV